MKINTFFFRNFPVTMAVFMLFSTFYSCDSDDILKENYYTFTGELVGEYLQSRPEYSEFTRMLDTTEVMGLLKAYGEYTCFAPTNDAMYEFYKLKGKTSISDFTIDTLTTIVYDHIIKGFIIGTGDFVEGRLNQKTMSDRFISITYKDFNETSQIIRVNQTSPILQTNIEVHNGIIHKIGEVLNPSERTLVEELSADKKFTLFYEALTLTELDKELMLVEDKSYDPDLYTLLAESSERARIPQKRKYGYTILAESDSLYETYGIYTLNDLKDHAARVYDLVYPEDAGISDVTNRKNSLNRFIAYHLINKEISYSKFIIDLDNTGHSVKLYDMYEYIETMCPNTLMEVQTFRTTNETNLFNMIHSPDDAVRIVESNYDNDATNGVYHEIDKILAYNIEFAAYISTIRLRMDAASFFPEFANNGIRGNLEKGGYPSALWKIPPGYCDRITTSPTTEFGYFDFDPRYLDYQGDEVFLTGLYEFTVTTPPIPAGTYEVRFGWKVETKRGVAQLYWDGKPTGIPLDLRIFATNPRIGYETPGIDPADPYGYENDKAMRNRGYMKGPASFKAATDTWFSSANSRMDEGYCRRILGIFTFDEPGTHEFGVKAVQAGEFMFDFLEFVPLEVLEKEGID